MQKIALFLVLALTGLFAFSFHASAQSTYTTTNGPVNLVAGLTNLTSFTAINTTNQSLGIGFITDGSWSTGIANLGGVRDPLIGLVANNGTLAGDFGGGTFFGANNGVIVIGSGFTNMMGSWTIRLLLADDTYSAPIGFNSDNLVANVGVVTTNAPWFQNSIGSLQNQPSDPTLYQELNIAAFDTNNIGFKGIELSNLGPLFPEFSYIGVTSPVPEPSTYALLALSAAGLGGYVLRRRRK